MITYYYLDGKEVKSTTDVIEWSRNRDDRKILRRTTIRRKPFTKGNKRMLKILNRNRFDVWVSTVCLGIDHDHTQMFSIGEKPEGYLPLIFETMVFPIGSYDELYMDRYRTYDSALAGHEEAVRIYGATGTIISSEHDSDSTSS